VPTNAPTNAPTNIPTNAPTLAPMTGPTPSPTSPPTAKPTFGTAVCGNDICEPTEDSISCPGDCTDIKLAASPDGGSGAEGIMFEVNAVRDVIITSLDFHCATGVSSNVDVEVYSKPGSFDGFEGDVTAWQLIHQDTILTNRRNTPTPLNGFDTSIFVRGGTTQSFYLYTPNKIMYLKPTNLASGELAYNDGNVQLFAGVGVTEVKFPSTSSNIVSPRVFRGSISYDAGSCGNGICDKSETSSTCPSDCTFTEQALQMSPDGGSGAIGAMFSVKALNNLEIYSFDFYSARNGNDQVQVYTRPGPYASFEFDESAWTLIHDDPNVELERRSQVTPLGEFDSSVPISAGSVQSFFVYAPRKVMYNGGTSEGQLFSSDGNLEFYEGIGLTAKFDGDGSDIYSPRVFRGTIRYRA